MALSASDDRAISAKAWTIVAWIFTFLLGVIAAGETMRGALSVGVVTLFAAVAIAPWTASASSRLFQVKVHGWQRVAAAIALLVVGSFIPAPSIKEPETASTATRFSPNPRGVRLA